MWGNNLSFGKIFAENCMKIKEIGPKGEGRLSITSASPPAPPPPLALYKRSAGFVNYFLKLRMSNLKKGNILANQAESPHSGAQHKQGGMKSSPGGGGDNPHF